MDHTEFKKQLLEDEKVSAEYRYPDIATEIGDMVWDRRIRRGLTQNELAEKCNTSQSSIARIENGDQIPTIKTLQKIALALKFNLELPELGLEGTSQTEQKIEFNNSGLIPKNWSTISASALNFFTFR